MRFAYCALRLAVIASEAKPSSLAGPHWIASSLRSSQDAHSQTRLPRLRRLTAKIFPRPLDNIPTGYYPYRCPIPWGTRTGCAVRVDRAGARGRAFAEHALGRHRGSARWPLRAGREELADDREQRRTRRKRGPVAGQNAGRRAERRHADRKDRVTVRTGCAARRAVPLAQRSGAALRPGGKEEALESGEQSSGAARTRGENAEACP
jgi:hypothetical protein